VQALLSVSEKTGLVELGAVTCLGVQLITSGGAVRALAETGLPVMAVETVKHIHQHRFPLLVGRACGLGVLRAQTYKIRLTT